MVRILDVSVPCSIEVIRVEKLGSRYPLVSPLVTVKVTVTAETSFILMCLVYSPRDISEGMVSVALKDDEVDSSVPSKCVFENVIQSVSADRSQVAFASQKTVNVVVCEVPGFTEPKVHEFGVIELA